MTAFCGSWRSWKPLHPELASPLSPTKRVGGQALSQFEKVEHPVPLESLQDVFSMEELGNLTPGCGKLHRRQCIRWSPR